MVRAQIKGGVWKNSEDEVLKAAVMKYGKNQWSRVASLLNRKSAKQCKARWFEWLDPSIKKTEWSREEDEKLLHLAKLMPTQWRTIAPLVGRTAAQCLERYEQLLDLAEREMRESNAGAGPDSGSSSSAVASLRTTGIDIAPETRPARPDPVDMDEDEKEMLSEARARLANTRGKKAKRKARERQLEEARRLATLQKRRELKAAGVLTGGSNAGLPKLSKTLAQRQGREISDYNAEIPFERPAPAGSFDVSQERHAGERLARSRAAQDTLMRDMNDAPRRKREAQEAAKQRAEEKRRRQEQADLPSVLEREKQADIAASQHKRQRLALPQPQVTDRELEEIARMGSAASEASAAAAQAVADGAGAQSGTKGLLSDYSASALVRAGGAGTFGATPLLGRSLPSTAMATPATALRTPARPDLVMEEARNELTRKAVAATPLMSVSSSGNADDDDGAAEDRAGTSAQLRPGTGFKGIMPPSSTLVSGQSHADAASGAPGATPQVLPGAMSASFSSSSSMAPPRQRAAPGGRKAAAPPLGIARDDLQINAEAISHREADGGDNAWEEPAGVVGSHDAGRDELDDERISAELRKGFQALPKPSGKYKIDVKSRDRGKRHRRARDAADQDTEAEFEVDASEKDARKAAEDRERVAALLARRSAALRLGLPRPDLLRLAEAKHETAVDREVYNLLEVEAKVFPGSGDDVRDAAAAALLLDQSEEDPTLLDSARRLVDDQVAQDGRAPSPAVESSSVEWVCAQPFDSVEMLAVYKSLFHDAVKGLADAKKRADKDEKHAQVLTAGLQKRARAAYDRMRDASLALDQALDDLAGYRELHALEASALQSRLARAEAELAQEQEREKELQDRFAALQG